MTALLLWLLLWWVCPVLIVHVRQFPTSGWCWKPTDMFTLDRIYPIMAHEKGSW